MKRALLVLILMAFLLGSAAYFIRNRSVPPRANQSPSASTGNEPVVVTVASARRRPVRRSITLVGTLRSDNQASLSVKIPSKAVTVEVRPGARVQAGQLLIRFDTQDASLQMESAGAGLASADALLRKAIDGKRAKSIDLDSQISQARGNLQQALTKLRQAELGATMGAATADSDSERAAAALRQADAGLRFADASCAQAAETLKRMKFLYSRGGIPRVDLEGAQAQDEIARAQRDSAVAAVDQAKAAAKPASSAAPLRKQVSEAEVVSARSGVTLAEESLRSARLSKVEALRIADRDIEAAQAQVRQARAGRRQAIYQTGAGSLVSPVSGVVTDVSIHAGEIAQPGQTLVTIVGSGKLYLEASAPARYSGLIKPGQAARITMESIPGRVFDGEVSRVLGAASLDSRSIPVQIRVDAAGATLTPGVMARASVDLARDENAVSIPVDALRNEGSMNFVYVVTSGVAQRRNPTFGAVEGAYVEVLRGVNSGEQVIISGPASLQSGTPVQVVGR